jgi:MGT family glycosyltransferase
MRYLFFPAPAHGHVNPMMPLARELVSRGEQVHVYLTREFEPQVRSAGATLDLLGEEFSMFKHVEDLQDDGPVEAEKMFRRMMPKMLNAMADGMRLAPGVLERLRSEEPGCLVYDPMCLWGRSVAAALRWPAATFHTTFVMTPDSAVARKMREQFPKVPPPAALVGMLRLFWSSTRNHRRHGMPRLGLSNLFYAEEPLNIVPVPRPFQAEAERFDERFIFVGPAVLDRGDSGDFPLERLEEGRPTLLISLGTTPLSRRPDFFQACFTALGGTRWQVVLACGPGVDPSRLGAPDNFIVRQRVPQLEVLKRARVFITHCGMNSTMEALWYGVPIVAFPQMGEQAFNADRVVELGAGLRLMQGLTPSPQALREAVERLDTEPQWHTRLAELQVSVRESGGPRRAADALQQYVARQQPRLRAAS